jgi:hypothetical protein
MPLEGFFNRSSLDEVRTSVINWTDSGNEHFAGKIRYSEAWTGNYSAAKQPTTQSDGAEFTVDADGDSSELDLEVTEQIIDETGSAGTDNTLLVPGDNNTTLGAFITTVNGSSGLQGKLEMVATNAPHNHDTGTNDWIDQTQTFLPKDGRWTDILNIDNSEVDAAFLRISYPEIQDSGRIMILRIAGDVTYGSGTGTVKLYRDPFNDAGTAPTLLVDLGAPGATTVHNLFWDYNKMEAPVFRGPLLLGVEAFTNPSAINFEVVWMPVEW